MPRILHFLLPFRRIGRASPQLTLLGDDADAAVDVTVLVPSRNEAGNVTTMAQRLDAALRPLRMSWELLFVDDSDDETPAVIESLHAHERRIRLLHRPRRRRRGGLSGAVVAGARVARGRSVVVLDGDLQHPPELVPELATLVGTGYCDIAVASRYVPGAAATGLSSRRRRLASAACTGFAHLLVRGTRGVHDPMSGFFATRRDSIVDKRLHPRGFKILMELLGRNPAAQVAELPFAMAERESGRSKAGPIEGMRFLWHVSRLARPTFRTMGAAIVRCAALAPLLAILAVQGWLSYRLVHANTAFVDEATYLSAGHYILQMGPRSGGMHFATYFSGAPAIYPVLAAFVDSFAGLDGARYMSLAFMLIATVLCYATASRLWGRPAGWFAAGIFVTTQGTQFLGAFATFDAMALMLVALAAWLVVRFASGARRSSAIFIAVPVLLIANATKYASALYDPVVLAMAFSVVLEHNGVRAALRSTAMLLATLVLGLALLIGLASSEFMTGILSTTVSRAASSVSPFIVLEQSWGWVGAIASLAVVATVGATGFALRRKAGWPTVGLLAVLAAAVLLAPANQARIDTATSLSKHVTFGAWFGAVGASWLMYKLAGVRWRSAWRYPIIAAALIPMALVGTAQAWHLYDGWPDAAPVTAALRPLVSRVNTPILMDDAEVQRYYLEDVAPLPLWVDTFYFKYTPPGSPAALTGPQAYAAAVEHGFFSVIALDYGQQKTIDHAVAAAIHDSQRYAWVGDFTVNTIYGRDTFVVWRVKETTS